MLDTPAKSPFQSLGVIGSAGAILTSALSVFGVQVAPGVSANIDAVITGGFAVLALYGRLRATKRITTAPAAPAV